ncbi:unnamed protein product [Paramecium pentaurelia]|uniref:Uncharacterized protein n=1 Tax=Paramecium pentaurelia TaxID=43138 RepID=A0A8S1TBI6_9CILI|nr:unnamed protein product [Paramecium pentaurelia]
MIKQQVLYKRQNMRKIMIDDEKKTKVYKNFIQKVICKYQEKCIDNKKLYSFVHGDNKLKYKINQYHNFKKKVCKIYYKFGNCSYEIQGGKDQIQGIFIEVDQKEYISFTFLLDRQLRTQSKYDENQNKYSKDYQKVEQLLFCKHFCI